MEPISFRNTYYAPNILGQATEKEVIAEAVRRMQMLKFPADIIEGFESEGKPGFCMENGDRVPLGSKDRRMISMLDSAGYLVYAVVRSREIYRTESFYIVLSRFRAYWGREREHLKNNLFLSYSNHEFKIVKAYRLPNGLLRRRFPEFEEDYETDGNEQENEQTTDPSSELKDMLPDAKKEDNALNAEEIESLKQEIYDKYEFYYSAYCIERPFSPDRALLNFFMEAPEYCEADAFVDDLFQNVNAYRLTYNLDDYISLARDLYLVSQGTIEDIIVKSGLSKSEFCTKLGIDYCMPDVWDSGEEVCSQEYRYLIGRYLGIIREPSFVRDIYSYSAEHELSRIDHDR